MSFIIDNMLWRYHFLAESSDDYYHRVGADAIAWYLSTGRACADWEKAILRANPKKLLAKVAIKGAGCEADAIKVINSYLERYCGYRAEANSGNCIKKPDARTDWTGYSGNAE